MVELSFPVVSCRQQPRGCGCFVGRRRWCQGNCCCCCLRPQREENVLKLPSTRCYFKVSHGLSNALVLPHVLRFNAETEPEPYAELARLVFPDAPSAGPSASQEEAAFGLADSLAALSARCGLQQRLREVGVTQDSLPQLAADSMLQTRLLVNNPREVTEADALKIYETAW